MRRTTIVLMLLVISVMWSSPAPAMTGMQPDLPSQAVIESKIASIQSDATLDEVTKNRVIELYRAASEQISSANTWAQKAAEFVKLTVEAPALLSTIRAELAQPPLEPVIAPAPDATLAQIEQELSQATAGLQAARVNLADLQAESTRRNELRPALTDRLVKARQELVDMSISTTGPRRPDRNEALSEAQDLLEQSRFTALQREIESIESELASYDARRELLPARRDRAQRRVTLAEKTVTAWQSVVASRRQAEAERAAADARRLGREAARQHPVLKNFAEETVVRANQRVNSQNIVGGSLASTQRLDTAKAELASINSRFESIRNRLQVSGLNRATGLLLRHQYEALPDIPALKRDVKVSQERLDDLDYTKIELQEERVDAGDIDRVAQSLIAEIPPEDQANNQAQLLEVARELATARRDLLDQLIGDASNGFDHMDELNAVLRQTVDIAETYKAYIEERILWVRSIAADQTPTLDALITDLSWLLDPKSWTAAWSKTRAYMGIHRLGVGITIALLFLLYLSTIRFRQILRSLSEKVARYTTDSFRHTLSAFLLTVLVASPLAATMYMIGWVLRAPEGQIPVAMAMGAGLQSTALFLYPIVFFRHLLRPRGLALAHFRWSKDTTQPLRKNLRWFIPVVVPMALLVYTFDFSGDEAANASLGRILFSLQLIALATFLYRVLRPTGPVLKRYMDANTGGWVQRLRYVWFALAIMLPLAFAIISWMGFHYTALQLQSRLEHSLILALVLVVISEMLHRWLYVARRRVAVEDAKRRRAQAETASKPATADNAPQTTTSNVSSEDEKVNLPALSEQTRQLFRTSITVSAVIGLYIIWAQALPALRMFDLVQVWPRVQILQPEPLSTDAPAAIPHSSRPQTQSESQPQPLLPLSPSSMTMNGSGTDQEAQTPDDRDTDVSITIADLGLSVIILIATWIAFRNVPGLIEIVVLQRLPLDAGSRYALSTVLRYIIAIIGVAITFQTIGLAWDKVQWLAAALTFGLAFGLQEIFANFVSGLIILAERPIRLGDTITVGGVTGTVARIRMRATTIADWDRKELVIPNKTFITGDVINWSLSDPTLRVKVNVGVSYSSDIDQVETLLRKIAKECPSVLSDPEPTVVFKEFGDSTLNFELRVFIPHIDYFVPVRHKLHNTIFKVFKDSGVEIAFPQRDLHVRSIGDLSKLIDQRSETSLTTESKDIPVPKDALRDAPKD